MDHGITSVKKLNLTQLWPRDPLNNFREYPDAGWRSVGESSAPLPQIHMAIGASEQ